ncbi:MAG: NUDIX domain-containing protein [bacterium]
MINLLLQLFRPLAMIQFALLKRYLLKHCVLPQWYFYQIGYVFPAVAFELLVFRHNKDKLEILLTQRESDDKFWPGWWHFPGTIIRITDSVESVWKRLADEVGVDKFDRQPRLVDFNFSDNKRGHGGHLFYLLEVDRDANFPNGQFFPIDDLPEPILDHQPAQIEQAAKLLKNKTTDMVGCC